MSFRCPIGIFHHTSRNSPVPATSRIEVPLTVLDGPQGEAQYVFIFDTGSAVTTVGEDVATALGLPAGGRTVGVSGSTGAGTGRLVPVRFRFPPDLEGGGGLETSSTWLIVGGTRKRLALLGFDEVHRHFRVVTDRSEVVFVRWGEPVTV